jgi:hypothetical protein
MSGAARFRACLALAAMTQLMNGIFPDHACAETIDNRTTPAREAAFTIIQAQLGKQGIVARTPDPDVIWSSNSGLDWYVGLVNLAGRSLADVPAACGALKAPGAGSWRVPTSAQMKTLISIEQNGNQWPGKPYDTPDHRFFGAVITTQPDQTLRFFTSNAAPAMNGLTGFDTFEYSGLTGEFTEQAMVARTAGEVKLGSFDRVLCVSPHAAAPAPTT